MALFVCQIMAGFTAYKKVRDANNNYIVIELFVPTDPCPELKTPLNNLHRTDVRDKNYAKFRCNGAKVVKGNGESIYPVDVVYTEGEWVYPDAYDMDPDKVCCGGIHFFLTRDAAECFHIGQKDAVRSYYNNGQLQYHIPRLDGQEHGISYHYTEDGELLWKHTYVHGVLNGDCENYYTRHDFACPDLYAQNKNRLKTRYVCKDGVLDGLHESFDLHGKLTENRVYVDGKFIEYEKYAKDGTVKRSAIFRTITPNDLYA